MRRAAGAALLGRDEHGCWRIHPGVEVRHVERRYRPGTMILDTDWECDGGVVRVTDFMPIGDSGRTSVVRIVEGLEGAVPVGTSLKARFGYGRDRRAPARSRRRGARRGQALRSRRCEGTP